MNCEDNKTSKEIPHSKTRDTVNMKTESKPKAAPNNNEDAFKLTDENAMEFFMTWLESLVLSGLLYNAINI